MKGSIKLNQSLCSGGKSLRNSSGNFHDSKHLSGLKRGKMCASLTRMHQCSLLGVAALFTCQKKQVVVPSEFIKSSFRVQSWKSNSIINGHSPWTNLLGQETLSLLPSKNLCVLYEKNGKKWGRNFTVDFYTETTFLWSERNEFKVGGKFSQRI